MEPALLKIRLSQTLPRDLIIDLYDMSVAEARKAFEMVRDHSGLSGRPARELIGQARFRMQEHGFRSACLLHGGVPLDGDVIAQSGLKVFQPFMRFQGPENGIIFGLAAMPEKGKIPTKNMSRLAGVTLNWFLTPRLDLDGTGPKLGDLFVLFLNARDPADAGGIHEVAVGIVDSAYQEYVLYLPIEEFLAGYADLPGSSVPPNDEPPADPSSGSLVRLKRRPKPFIVPEAQDPLNANEEDGRAG
ncbi:hypothetical protein [Azospirillum argentinense]|uniref:hypothetical protein n=1 Tax=Azospirillum argentinense TaxID=2970906 RepID=UPI0032DE9FDA